MLLWRTLGCTYLFDWVFFYFFSRYIPRSGIGSSIFKKPLSCFPQRMNQFTFSPTVYMGFLFSTSSLTLFVDFLMRAILTGEVIPHWGSDLHFLTISGAKHLFMCLLAILCLWKNICSRLLPTFWLNCFHTDLYKLFVYFGF